jgi:PIN domain nuclease of toxin-antitoxin system
VSSRILSDRLSPAGRQRLTAPELASLPAHHRDPFDRLLIARAQLEGLVVMTSDAQFSAYAVEVIGP